MDKNRLAQQFHPTLVAPPSASPEKPTELMTAELMPSHAPAHVEAAAPILKSSSTANRAFCAALVICGVAMIIWTPGMQIGIALIVVGVAAALWLQRSMYSTINELAELPGHETAEPRATVINNFDTGGGAVVTGDVTTGGDFVGRDQL